LCSHHVLCRVGTVHRQLFGISLFSRPLHKEVKVWWRDATAISDMLKYGSGKMIVR
jgi:hypothetical protein